MSSSTVKTHAFEADVKQVLDIVIHSLYSDRDVFLRELVANASDSLEKMRQLQLTESEIFDKHLESRINVTIDEAAGSLTIQDFGIGMNEAELVENLGQIAHSGSKAFLEALKQRKEDADLIGQFGVGFYSAFMVADEVRVHTHSWRKDDGGYVWISDGKGGYSIEASEGERRGCKIVLKLKENCKEYAKPERLKGILKRYSNFVPHPVYVNGDHVNTQEAIWLKNKSEIEEAQYKEFYKFQTHSLSEPMTWLHFSADAPIEIRALLYVPSENVEKHGFGRMDPAVSLHCRKILIDAKPKGLLPEWLRFLKGVVDSADLPLNISRESLQDHQLVHKIGRVLTKRFLKFLEELSQKDAAKYETLYNEFGFFLKQGLAEDFEHKQALAKLLRFESSKTEAGKLTTLTNYVEGMSADQTEIYILSGPSRDHIEKNPSLEVFKAKGIEVLYCLEGIDEYALSQLGEFESKAIKSAESSDLELSQDQSHERLSEEDTQAFLDWAKQALEDCAADVVASKRLVDSPTLVRSQDGFSTHMQRLMQGVNPSGLQVPMVLEVNPAHAIIRKLNQTRLQNPELASMTLQQLFDLGLLSCGLLQDPQVVVKRFYELMSLS